MNPVLPQPTLHWLDEPEDHNYPAAESYLNLLYEGEKSRDLVEKLKKSSLTRFKAKDIFRASQLSLLGVSNTHVAKNHQKIADGKALSPLLLVRSKNLEKVIVADGYHRLCAIYSLDEDCWIPCKIV